MPRKVPEWIGKTDDSKIPDKVKLRVFNAYGGRDAITGEKIRAGMPWDCDHEIALCNGGENRESNLRPLLRQTHKAKTKADVSEKAKVNRIRQKHFGIKKPKGQIRSRGFGKFKSNTRDINDE